MTGVPQGLAELLAPRYTVEREIGAGGMARVYLATEDHPHRKVAIKVLDPDLCTRMFRERFLREVELASSLNHPHIVPVFAAGGVDCYLYYVMPFIEGESLRRRLERDGPLRLPDALHIAGDVADALGYAHTNGIIHRDIKPENILLSGGHAVVADFGIARAISAAGQASLTQTGQPIGSLNYMSPEQAFGSGTLDARTDIYSLGCVVFEMLAGQPPARNPLDPRVQNWELLDRSIGLRDTGSGGRRGVKHAIATALRPTPEERFASAAEFAAALGVSRAARPSVPYRLIPNRVWHATVAGSAAIALVAAGFAVTAGRRPTLHRDRVVVAVIENHTGDSTLDNLGHMAADWVTQGLAQTGLLEVVPSTVVMSAEHESGHGPGHLDVRDIRALGRRTGAGTVVSGAFYRQADSVRFQLQITDARDGRVIRALDPVAGPTAQPLGALDVLRQRVMAALAVWVDPKLMGWASAASQPPTFDAYQEFVEGLDALTRNDWLRAREHLERAAAHDSTFTSARLWAAFARFNLDEFAAVDSVTRALQRAAGSLAPFDRAILTWLSAWVRGDREAGLAAARQAAALAPASGAPLIVAWDALVVNRPLEALAVLRELTPDHPLLQGAPTYWAVQTGALHALGDYRAELADARAGRRRFPDVLSVRADELRALAARGDIAAVAARLDESLTLPPEPKWTPADVALL
ncbi:MAG: protein kinase domain-containing protein, partial [Gemmatimonadales bacterium]